MPNTNKALVLLRGGGDLASGVALRLHRSGIKVVITELPEPLAVRRTVSFSEVVYERRHGVEGVNARLVKRDQLSAALDANEIPVLVDPDANILTFDVRPLTFLVVVDARLIKQPPSPLLIDVPLHIGLGPGFHAGEDCHAVIETRRSHTLGRVYWTGTTQPDSGEPEGDRRRVLRAPSDGVVVAHVKIGEHVEEGQVIAEIRPHVIPLEGHQDGVSKATFAPGAHLPRAQVPGSAGENLEDNIRDSSVAPLSQSDMKVVSPFKGVLRGLIRPGLHVTKGLKIGDVDPRDDPSACYLVSDKALSIGGGVLEAILSSAEIREKLFP
jgi:xanthine dehydrogenase accessory factor